MKKTTNKYCIPSSKILYVDEYSTSGEYINPKAFILNKNELIIINSIFFILILNKLLNAIIFTLLHQIFYFYNLYYL